MRWIQSNSAINMHEEKEYWNFRRWVFFSFQMLFCASYLFGSIVLCASIYRLSANSFYNDSCRNVEFLFWYWLNSTRACVLDFARLYSTEFKNRLTSHFAWIWSYGGWCGKRSQRCTTFIRRKTSFSFLFHFFGSYSLWIVCCCFSCCPCSAQRVHSFRRFSFDRAFLSLSQNGVPFVCRLFYHHILTATKKNNNHPNPYRFDLAKCAAYWNDSVRWLYFFHCFHRHTTRIIHFFLVEYYE